MKKLALLTIVLLAIAMTGCTEEQQKTPPVWGKGDLPAEWSTTFGNNNGSRMNFIQSQAINELAKRLRVLETNQYMPNYNRIDRVERWLTVHTAYGHTAYGNDPNE